MNEENSLIMLRNSCNKLGKDQARQGSGDLLFRQITGFL